MRTKVGQDYEVVGCPRRSVYRVAEILQERDHRGRVEVRVVNVDYPHDTGFVVPTSELLPVSTATAISRGEI